MARTLIACLLLVGCAERVSHVVSLPSEARTLDRESPYLKVHMKDGGLFVLRTWTVDEQAVSGLGSRYPANRSTEERGRFQVPLADVALFETNVVHTSPSVAMMAVVAGHPAGGTAFCLRDAKA